MPRPLKMVRSVKACLDSRDDTSRMAEYLGTYSYIQHFQPGVFRAFRTVPYLTLPSALGAPLPKSSFISSFHPQKP